MFGSLSNLPLLSGIQVKKRLIKLVESSHEEDIISIKDLTAFEWDYFPWFHDDSYGQTRRSANIFRFYYDNQMIREVDPYHYPLQLSCSIHGNCQVDEREFNWNEICFDREMSHFRVKVLATQKDLICVAGKSPS